MIQSQPELAALWISKAASAEVAKAKELLLRVARTGEAAPKKRHVAAGSHDARP